MWFVLVLSGCGARLILFVAVLDYYGLLWLIAC